MPVLGKAKSRERLSKCRMQQKIDRMDLAKSGLALEISCQSANTGIANGCGNPHQGVWERKEICNTRKLAFGKGNSVRKHLAYVSTSKVNAYSPSPSPFSIALTCGCHKRVSKEHASGWLSEIRVCMHFYYEILNHRFQESLKHHGSLQRESCQSISAESLLKMPYHVPYLRLLTSIDSLNALNTFWKKIK